MAIKRDLLLLTSLFPIDRTSAYGSYVYAQAIALSKLYNVKVIVEKKCSINKYKVWSCFLNNRTFFAYRYDECLGEFPFSVAFLEYDLYSFFSCRLQYLQLYEIIRRVLSNGDFQLSPDCIIHAHFSFNAGLIGQIISKEKGNSLVITEHHPNMSFDNEWGRIFRNNLDANMRFTVVSLYEYQRMKNKLPKNSLYILHNIVEENDFPLKSNNKVDSKFTILFVGYPHPVKGMLLMFEVAARFRECCDDIHFVVVSDDEKTSEFPMGINEYIIANKLDNICTLHPRVKHTQMADLYCKADVFLSTSYNETFGMSMLEALLCGTLVVATESGGPREFLNDQNSIICDCGDVDGLYESIRKVKMKHVVYDPIDIRNSVLGKYGINNFFNEIEKLY